MGMRISARLDDEASTMLADLQHETGKNVTEILCEALAAYHRQQVLARSQGTLALLALSGTFSDDADLSTRYKEVLGDGLDDKYAGHR